MQRVLLGSLASVGLVDPIDEEEDGGETLNVVLVRQLVFDGGVDLGEHDAVGLELGGGGVIGFLEEAEIFVVIVVVVVLRGDFIAESEGKGGEEKESGERERNDESFTS